MIPVRRRLLALAMLLFAFPASAGVPQGRIEQAKTILKRSIAFRTVEGQGEVRAYADYLGSILKQAGYAAADIEVIPVDDTAVLIARFPGTGNAKPIVLIAHMDVVEARPSDWTRDPFTAVEEGGYIFGRGAEDNKFDISMMVATLSMLRSEGYKPGRDIVLALSGDEETTGSGAKMLAQRLAGAELALNGDAGGGILTSDNKPLLYSLQTGEKTYADFEILVTDPGGHSSAPTPGNPIYRLARILERIESYDFPNQANELTRSSVQAAGRLVGGEMGAAMARYAANPNDSASANLITSRPEYVGQIRTTCVATMINGGHAANALPQKASATVNCRIFPGVPVESVKADLARAIADLGAKITILGSPAFSDASLLRPDVVRAVSRAIHARFPKLDIIPSMSVGATDGVFYRAAGIPTYGISPLFQRPDDGYSHGLNERIKVSEIGPALAYYRSVITELSR